MRKELGIAENSKTMKSLFDFDDSESSYDDEAKPAASPAVIEID